MPTERLPLSHLTSRGSKAAGSSYNPLNKHIAVSEERTMSLYGRLNAYIFLPSAAITLRVYEFVSGLPRVSSQGVAYGYASRTV